MAMRVPDAGNPFAVNVAIGGTRQMPTLKIPETKYGPDFVGANLEHAGTELQGAMAKWQEEIDTTRARDFTNKLQAKVNDIANNNDTGYKQLLGINALQRPDGRGLMETTQEDLKSYYEELRGSAGNERQRAALDEIYGDFSTRLSMDVSNHLTAQQIAWTKSVDQDTIREASRMAVSENAQERADGFTTLRAMAAKQAQQEGRPVEYASYLGGIHAVNVSNLVDNLSISAARQYLKENREEMTADQIVAAQNLIRKGAEQASIKGWTEKILKGIGTQNPEAAVLAANEAVEKVPEKLRDDVRKNVNARLGIQAQLRKAQAAQITEQIYTLRYKGEEVPLSLLDTLSTLDPQAALGFKQYQEKLLAEQAKGKSDIETDQETFNWLYDMYAGDPQGFQQLNLNQYRADLSQKDYERFRKFQTEVTDLVHKNYISKLKEVIEGDKTLSKFKADILRAADEIWLETEAGGHHLNFSEAEEMIKALTQEVGTWTNYEGKKIELHYGWEAVINRAKDDTAFRALMAGGSTTPAEYLFGRNVEEGNPTVDKERRTDLQLRIVDRLYRTGKFPPDVIRAAWSLCYADLPKFFSKNGRNPTKQEFERTMDITCQKILFGLVPSSLSAQKAQAPSGTAAQARRMPENSKEVQSIPTDP